MSPREFDPTSSTYSTAESFTTEGLSGPPRPTDSNYGVVVQGELTSLAARTISTNGTKKDEEKKTQLSFVGTDRTH